MVRLLGVDMICQMWFNCIFLFQEAQMKQLKNLFIHQLHNEMHLTI